MADDDARPDVAGGGRAFEWWMLANLANGAGYYAFVILLIPAYVTEVTGNAADAGVVMAILGLAAVVGPAVGRFADRHLAHRAVLSLGVLAMSLAFAAYALSSEQTALYALEALLTGLGVAAVNAIGAAFIVAHHRHPVMRPIAIRSRSICW